MKTYYFKYNLEGEEKVFKGYEVGEFCVLISECQIKKYNKKHFQALKCGSPWIRDCDRHQLHYPCLCVRLTKQERLIEEL